MDAPISSSSKRHPDPVTGDELKIEEEEEKEEREKFEEACIRIRAENTDETEIETEITMSLLDHLPARTRARIPDELLKRMYLQRAELKLSRYERAMLFLQRRPPLVEEDDDIFPEGPGLSSA